MVGTENISRRKHAGTVTALALAGIMLAVGLAVPGTSQVPGPLDCAPLGAAPVGCLAWQADYNSPNSGDDNAINVAYGGGKVFVTGASYNQAPTYYDYATTAYDAVTGEELWAVRFNGPANGDDFAMDLTATQDGSVVVVTGTVLWHPDTGHDAITIGYDGETGEQIWMSGRYTLGIDGFDLPRAIAMSPDESRVFVTVQSPGIDTASDYATIAYDTQTGQTYWSARYDGDWSRHDTPRDIAVSPDGSAVYVIGQTYVNPTRGYDYGLVAYDAQTGDEQWVSKYNGPASTVENGWKVAVAPDGETVYATGLSWAADNTWSDDYATVAYDAATGAQQWVHRYDGGGEDNARGLAVSPDGNRLFVTGSSKGDETTGWDAVTLAIDADGNEVWVHRFDAGNLVSETGSNSDHGREVAVSPDGTRLFVTGRSMGAVQEFLTLAYDTVSGTPLWQVRLHGDSGYLYDGESTGIAVDPDGSQVYVTGTTGFDYTTVAIRADGVLGMPI